MDVVVVIATYNEAGTIGRIIRAIPYPVIVVDDNSPDGTAEIARDAGATVLLRPAKSGIASAYYDGFRLALAQNPEYVIQMDAGLTHDPADIDRLLDKAREGYSLVIGARSFGWGRRAIVSRLAALLMLLRGVNVPDATGGFRCWRATELRRVISKPFRARHFAFQLEALWRARYSGIATVPIAYKLTNSSFRPTMILEALGIWATLDF